MHAFANAGIGPNSAGLGAGATSGGGGHLFARLGGGARAAERESLAARTAGSDVRVSGSPRSGSLLAGCVFPAGRAPVRARAPGSAQGAVNSAAPGAPPPATGIPALGIGIPGIGIPTDPGGSGTRDFLPGPGAPPRAPTATHALFSSTAEEVTQIVGSSGGTHHALGDGHHHHFHRAFGSAHQHFPVRAAAGAPYAYPAYPGSGSQGPTPPALRGPGLPAQNFGALGPAGARIGAAGPAAFGRAEAGAEAEAQAREGGEGGASDCVGLREKRRRRRVGLHHDRPARAERGRAGGERAGEGPSVLRVPRQNRGVRRFRRAEEIEERTSAGEEGGSAQEGPVRGGHSRVHRQRVTARRLSLVTERRSERETTRERGVFFFPARSSDSSAAITAAIRLEDARSVRTATKWRAGARGRSRHRDGKTARAFLTRAFFERRG